MDQKAPPLFSLAYTTVRPHVIAEVVKTWNERSALHDIEWVFGIDAGQQACLDAIKNLSKEGCRDIRVVINNGAKTCVA